MLLGACNGRGSTADASGLESVVMIPTKLHSELVENSIAVTSVRQPGIIFAANDSRNAPLLFAFDSTGKARAMWRVPGVRNRDWEAAALGPCGSRDSVPSCLYIGDVGDNEAQREFVSIYRLPEPAVPETAPNSRLPTPERIDFRYSDRGHDVEAMYVARDGSIFLITKRRLLDANRNPRRSLIFRLPPTAWDSSGIVTAMLVDSLPIVPGSAPGRLVTDASLSADGRSLAVRTYSEAFVFAVDTTRGLPVVGKPPTSCTVLGLDEHQGEGIGWWWDSRRLVLTSEGRNAPLFLITCALPES
jgi:hypothetical protein